MSARLDPEVAAALESADLRVWTFLSISAIRSPDARKGTYRIELDDGRTIKARLVRNEENARRLFEIRRALPPAFSPAFDRHGRVLLEEWIEGAALGDALRSAPPLDALDTLDAHVAAAAALLARLHATPTVLGEPVHDLRPTAARRADAERDLERIVAAGALEERAARALRAALARRDPGEATAGLVHTDFCGENMVVDRAGRLHVVDNERLSVDALGYDLGRTWCRWPLAPRQWEIFRSTYANDATTSGLEEPLASFAFWSIVAVLESAELRLRLDRDRAHVPLDRLRRMAADLAEEK